jgi:hypothetical protein
MRLQEITGEVKKIIDAQNKSGAWITKDDKFKKRMPSGERWNGQYLTMDRISSGVFNENIGTLCEFIALTNQLETF